MLQHNITILIHAYYVLSIIISAFSRSAFSPGRVHDMAVRIDIDSLCRDARGWRGREKDGCVTMRKRKRASDEKLVSRSHKWRRESRRDVLTFSTPRFNSLVPSRVPNSQTFFLALTRNEGERRQVGEYTDGTAAPRCPVARTE